MQLLHVVVFHFSKLVLWIAFRVGFGLTVTGQEHVPARGPFLLAANHVSYLDPPLVGAVSPRRVRFLARATLFHHPVLGAYLRAVGAMPVARGEADPSAVRRAIACLRRGDGLVIFPEGGRQPDGQLGEAKRGVGLLALHARCPIVPVVVRGTFEALPPGAAWCRRAKIAVAFGPSIPYTMFSHSPSSHDGGGRVQQERLAAEVTRRWRELEGQLARRGAGS